MNDLEQHLRELAEKANPSVGTLADHALMPADQEYLDAVDPATIITLLDLLRDLRREHAELVTSNDLLNIEVDEYIREFASMEGFGSIPSLREHLSRYEGLEQAVRAFLKEHTYTHPGDDRPLRAALDALPEKQG